MLVEFIHRVGKPESPKSGRFYWIESGDENQIWFSPDENPDNMLLLNWTFDGLDENVQNELKEFIKEQGYLSKDDLKTVNGENLYKDNAGDGNIEIKVTEIDDELKKDIINQVKKEVETRSLEWTVIQ